MSDASDGERGAERAGGAEPGTPSAPGGNEPVTYRGRDLDELLPKIRAELGPDAIVIRQREGLDGGVAGFFQKRCVEVVARRATPGLDAYDAPSAPAGGAHPPAPEPQAPAIAEIMRVASPFIEQLRAAEVAVAAPAPVAAPEPERAPVAAPAPLAEPEPERAPVAADRPVIGAYGTSAYAVTAGGAMAAVEQPADPVATAPAPALALVPDEQDDTPPAPPQRTGAAAAHERTLVDAGLAAGLAAELVAATVSHVLAFEPRRTLKRALREALARRIPISAPVPAGARAIAFVGAGGSGKTRCAERLAAAYREHSDLDVHTISLTAVAPAPAPAAAQPAVAAGTLTVIDTAALSPGSPADVKRLAADLRRLGRPEVHVTVPATLSGNAVRTLLDGFAPLKPAAIVLTHLDEVGHAGPVIDEAIARGIAISYTSDGSAPQHFSPADPAALAAPLLA